MKILVVRRDNIGDLVLTTPVFAALRRAYPQARIDALVNSYNAPVVEGHPFLDRVHIYTKTKHTASRREAFSLWTGRLGLWRALRGEAYDYVVLAAPAFRLRQLRQARVLRPRHIAAFVPPGARPPGVDLRVEHVEGTSGHHVEATFRILSALGIDGPIPELSLGIDRAPRREGRRAPLVGVHVSARRPMGRWPEERYAPMMGALHERTGARFRLFWAPGAEDEPRHPGDDERAGRIHAQRGSVPVEPLETRTLRDLIAGLGECDALVCSDGGAMHLAAALGKPIVCLFGDSVASHWHPWGVPYRLLQAQSRDARDISVDEVVEAFVELAAESRIG